MSIILAICGTPIEVSEEDYEFLSQFDWRINTDGYPVVVDFHMHRIIASRMKIRGQVIDHKDRRRTNCQRTNLRPATYSQNSHNRIVPVASSGYRGVRWKPEKNKFRAAIRGRQGREVSLGYFDDAIEAAKRYDIAAKRIYGDFAVLNFPD